MNTPTCRFKFADGRKCTVPPMDGTAYCGPHINYINAKRRLIAQGKLKPKGKSQLPSGARRQFASFQEVYV